MLLKFAKFLLIFYLLDCPFPSYVFYYLFNSILSKLWVSHYYCANQAAFALRILKIYSLGKFRANLSIQYSINCSAGIRVIMMYMRSSELIHLIIEDLYTLTASPYFLHPLIYYIVRGCNMLRSCQILLENRPGNDIASFFQLNWSQKSQASPYSMKEKNKTPLLNGKSVKEFIAIFNPPPMLLSVCD